jgi:hypothetical protein
MNNPVRRVPAVPPASTVQPAPAARVPRAAPKPPAAPPAAEWEKAERHGEAQLLGVGGVVIPAQQQGGGDGQSQDQGGGMPDRPGDAVSTAGRAGADAGGDPQQDLPASLARLGGLVVAFAVHATTHGGWAAHVPLSGDLLVATTLHLNCEHGVLTLRFETSDWDSRDLVSRHAQGLVQRLRGALPTLSAVELVV